MVSMATPSGRVMGGDGGGWAVETGEQEVNGPGCRWDGLGGRR